VRAALVAGCEPGRDWVRAAPDVDALADAIRQVDALPRDRPAIRATAERFDRSVFLARWRELLEQEGFGGLVAG